MKVVKILGLVYTLFMIFNAFSTEKNQKQLILNRDSSYLSNFNTSENTNERQEFNEVLQKWAQELTTQENLKQSEYDQQLIQMYHKGILSGGFSSVETEKFISQLLNKKQKGIFEEAMEKAGIIDSFSEWVGNHEIKARTLVIEKLSEQLKSIKEKTPEGIRNAIRITFGEEKLSSANGFWYGSFTTFCFVGLFWTIKFYIDKANIF
jgi:hypothetical protein